MARTTKYTVTLPDDTTATRRTARTYAFVVVARDDNHAQAAECLAYAEELERYHAAVVAVIDSGDLGTFKRVKSSYSVAGGWSYSSYHPMAEESALWIKQAAAAEGRNYKPTAASMAPWLPDYTTPTEWEKYRADAVARILAVATLHRDKAAVLLAGPKVSYHAVRWSSSYDSASKATGSAELGARLSYRRLSVLPVD